jgi:hypothetical protein
MEVDQGPNWGSNAKGRKVDSDFLGIISYYVHKVRCLCSTLGPVKLTGVPASVL